MRGIFRVVLVITFLFGSNVIKADNWLYSFDDAKKLAVATNKLILVDFWASWCGPCKKMDQESWSQDEIKQIMNNYVSVQIDVDVEKELARKYNVRGIPYIFIMDANGEVVHEQMSYMNKAQVKKLLDKFSLNTKFLQRDYVIYKKMKNSTSSFRLAQSYQHYAIFLDKNVRSDFLKLSINYLYQTKKYLNSEKKNDDTIDQKIELIEIQEKVIRGNFKRCLKELNKGFKEDEIAETNRSLFFFLNYVSCKGVNDEATSEIWLEKLKSMANHKSYLKRAEKILS